MRHLKGFKIYENAKDMVSELPYVFNTVASKIEVFEIPYSYYGKALDFNIYVVFGNRVESELTEKPDPEKFIAEEKEKDYTILQEIYHTHKILQEIYNLGLYNISLTKNEIFITLYDYKSNSGNKVENYIGGMKYYLFQKYLPVNIYNKIKKFMCRSELSRGINYSNGDSSNLSLFKWLYE